MWIGSSPRVWGIQKPVQKTTEQRRFIPTRVGNTFPTTVRVGEPAVHPHACGEYCIFPSRQHGPVGSSPRVWGIRGRECVLHGGLRFIPTRVGNTIRQGKMSAPASVHPHACGEYGYLRGSGERRGGSSPRVWGIHAGYEHHHGGLRFIPTRVGNTEVLAISTESRPVHPHACGEYRPPCRYPYVRCGSSPRVWGIRRPERSHHARGRFIPTRVGNTVELGQQPVGLAVHPHACGEYDGGIMKAASETGSSPRVWGIQEALFAGLKLGRFIPTRVGNTLLKDARNNRLLAELQRATEPCVLQAYSDNDKKGKELCKAAPSPRKKLPGRAVMLS